MDGVFRIIDVLDMIDYNGWKYMSPEKVWLICPEIQNGWSIAELEPDQIDSAFEIEYSDLYQNEVARGVCADRGNIYITIDEKTYRKIQRALFGDTM